MAKKRISQSEFLQLQGLKVLAMNHTRAMRDLEEAVARIVGEKDEGSGYFGHASDFVWDDNTDVARILKNLGIEIKPVREAERRRQDGSQGSSQRL